MSSLQLRDPELYDLISKERDRQNSQVELIASENFVDAATMEAVGSVMINKYTEGYPGNRYYGGTKYYDEMELLCQQRWLKAFGVEDTYRVNVQPHSGSQANFAAYVALGMTPGDTMLCLNLNFGGHLTMGSTANFSGKLYKVVQYNTNDQGLIDMDDVRKLALECKPKVIVAGASAYPRIIDFKKFREIADEVGAYLMADISHIAGLVVAGEHPTPFGYADIVTTTTHKTLRSARGAMIFSKPELSKKVDSAIFPYSQGGPLQNMIAGKTYGGLVAQSEEYHNYIKQVVKNTKAMCDEFIRLGYDIITGGTDNHLFLIDFSKTHPKYDGKMIQDYWDRHGYTTNKNMIPNDKRGPQKTSGIRIGLAAQTTKGWVEEDCIKCAREMHELLEEFEFILGPTI